MRVTVFKQEAENKWLYTISNNVCKQAVKDAVDAYQKFFKGLSKHTQSIRAGSAASLVSMLTQ